MQTIIKKWGNSLALRLPQHVAADLRIAEGAAVSLSIENDALIVKPARKRYRLEDLLASHIHAANHPEAEWGKPVGKEEW